MAWAALDQRWMVTPFIRQVYVFSAPVMLFMNGPFSRAKMISLASMIPIPVLEVSGVLRKAMRVCEIGLQTRLETHG